MQIIICQCIDCIKSKSGPLWNLHMLDYSTEECEEVILYHILTKENPPIRERQKRTERKKLITVKRWWLLTPERFWDLWYVPQSAMKTDERHKQNPNSSKHKSSPTHRSSVTWDNLPPFWWDHIATCPGCAVLPVRYTQRCCSRCRASLPLATSRGSEGTLFPCTAYHWCTTLNHA